MSIELYEHQGRISSALRDRLRSRRLAILHAPERSGKTLAVIDAIEGLNGVRRVLWITKKAAIGGIEGDLEKYGTRKAYTVVNYERLHKVEGDFDLIVIDEFHYAISSYPKSPAKAKIIRERWGELPAVLISATPAPESASQWFHPLWIFAAHPFSAFTNFYQWARVFVWKRQRQIMGRIINDYSQAKSEKVMDQIRPYLLQITRDELGFRYRPKVVPHYVTLSPRTQALIEMLKRDRVLRLPGGVVFAADTPIGLVNGCYQLECGCLKVGLDYHDTGEREMAEYIKKRWGDSEDVAIMCRWVGQRRIFEREFKKAMILSSHAHAEGVELSHIEHLIVASLDYSTARFQQRNARQASKQRKSPINVHILLSRGNVSEAVYQAVALKHMDFKARMFTGQWTG
ncbi:hypothetical protein [Nitratifractor salsuginis]|nr:hypothetical protein [Nitratifractor salsuginis]